MLPCLSLRYRHKFHAGPPAHVADGAETLKCCKASFVSVSYGGMAALLTCAALCNDAWAGNVCDAADGWYLSIGSARIRAAYVLPVLRFRGRCDVFTPRGLSTRTLAYWRRCRRREIRLR